MSKATDTRNVKKPLMETVTIKQPVPRVIADLVDFGKYIETVSMHTHGWDDATWIKLARAFWDRQHGED